MDVYVGMLIKQTRGGVLYFFFFFGYDEAFNLIYGFLSGLFAFSAFQLRAKRSPIVHSGLLRTDDGVQHGSHALRLSLYSQDLQDLWFVEKNISYNCIYV